MSLCSQTVKNLISGVSQQAPVLRYPEQLEEQINAFSTEVGGLQKRPPTINVAALCNAGTVLDESIAPLAHVINRDETEQYILLFTGDDIKIWDIQGNPKNVTTTSSGLNYINHPLPREGLKVLTVADYTFIVNTSYTVRMTEGNRTPDYWAGQGALINIKSGQYGRTYSITLSTSAGVIDTPTVTTPDGSDKSHTTQIDTNHIANSLANLLASTGRWSVATGEGWLYCVPTSGVVTTVSTKDGFNNTAMYGFLKTSQRFNMLPATAPNNYTVKILGEPTSGNSSYYVRFDAAENVWKETAQPNIDAQLDPWTMPHALTRQADGTFRLDQITWDKRKTGDDDSNPIPSFVDGNISDLFFFRNRLGIVSGENAVLSKVGEFFNFWMTSAVDVLDTDCIDLAVSHNKVSILNHAIPFNEELLLFSAQTQFVLRAEGTLTPKTATINQTTEFECSSRVKPVGAGKNLYFPAERSLYTSIKEYFVQTGSDIKNAQDITAHIPSYIPNGVHKLISSTTENVLLALTRGEKNAIYVYKYLFIDDQRVQSSWSKWTFGDCEVLGGDFINSTLYLLMKRGKTVFLEKMIFTFNTQDFPEHELFRVMLDRKICIAPHVNDSTVSYRNAYDRTVINLQPLYTTSSLKQLSHMGVVTEKGTYVACPIKSGNILLEGNYQDQKLIIGEPYEWKVVFSEIMVKTKDETGSVSADIEGRLQLQNFWVNYANSGDFTATVEHRGKGTYEYKMTSKLLGGRSSELGVLHLETGKFRFPVQSCSANCKITLTTTAPTPLALVGAGWDGNYVKRTRQLR